MLLMSVRFREDRQRWVADIDLPDGRFTRHFLYEADAEQFHHLMAGKTMAKLHCLCQQIDWGNRTPTQVANAWRAAEFFGYGTHPGAITTQELDRFVAWQRSQGNDSVTIRKYLSAIQVMLKRAIRLDWIKTLPLFPEGRTLPLPEPRDLVIRDEWFSELLDCCDKREYRDLKQVLIFIREMGCRREEAFGLRWDRIDLNAGKIQFVKTKNLNARTLDFSEKTRLVLSTMKQRYNTPLVFPMSSHTLYVRYKGRNGTKPFKGVIADVCDNLGLGQRVKDEWCFHTLRHTKITMLARAGIPAPKIQYWAGHKSLEVTQKYIHNAGVDIEDLACI